MAKTFVDFVGLNTFVHQKITSSAGANIIGYPLTTNILVYENDEVIKMDSGSAGSAASRALRGKTGKAQIFSALNLKRNGPYGFSSWGQIRSSQNPLTRHQIKNSHFTFVNNTDGQIRREITTSGEDVPRKDRYSKTFQFEEPSVSSKTSPLVWNVGLHERNQKDQINLSRFSIKSSYANNLLFFSNERVNNVLKINPKDEELEYGFIREMYLSGGLNDEDSPITHWEFLKYKETIFPQAKYAFRTHNRNREKFVSLYRASSTNRLTSSTTSSFGVFFRGHAPGTTHNTFNLSQSKWPLDIRSDFSSLAFTTSSYVPLFSSSFTSTRTVRPYHPGAGSAGILQNNYSQFNVNMANIIVLDTGFTDESGITAERRHQLDNSYGVAPNYYRRQTQNISSSYSNPSGMINLRSDRVGNTTENQFSGDAPWDAPKQSGRVPFPDTYAEFAQDLRVKGKDYSIVPEFRITPHVAQILEDGAGFNTSNLFEITGGQENKNDSSHEDFYKVYSTSDFLRHFEMLQEDHDEFTNSKVFTLRCKALKKFVPYDGFYPCQRTVALAQQFKDSYLDHIDADAITAGIESQGINPASQVAQGHKQILFTPLFSPGVLFNTIKSGVACDYPMFLGGDGTPLGGSSNIAAPDRFFSFGDGTLHPASSLNMITKNFSTRIPFEALLEPERYLANRSLVSPESHASGSLKTSAAWSGQGDRLYKLMANNFFGEVPEFFLEEESFSSLVSKPQKSILPFEANKTYSMRLKMYRSMNKRRLAVSSSNEIIYFPPQDILSGSYDNFSPGANDDNTPRETFTMYSRPGAFGPPSLGITKFAVRDSSGNTSNLDQVWYQTRTSTTGSRRDNIIMDSRHGFNFPFTPPYYHGECWMDMHVKFTTGGRKTLDEIFANIQKSNPSEYHKGMEFYRAYDVFTQASYLSAPETIQSNQSLGPQSFGENNINRNALQMTASVNVFGQGELKSIDILDDDSRQEVNLVVNTQEENEKRWVIQTKFETPMLNFNHFKDQDTPTVHADITPVTYGLAAQPIGMWHQFGRVPAQDEGVFLQITDIPSSWVQQKTTGSGDPAENGNVSRVGANAFTTGRLNNGYNQGATDIPFDPAATGSLVQICGFSTEPVKLGRIAKKKTIREAVVAIPFVEENNTKRFFKLDKDEVRLFIGKVTRPTSKLGLSVKQQILKMERYIFPPSFDFINNPQVDPIAMYIFEFSHVLDKDDLSHIWQNLSPPSISDHYIESEALISHPLLEKELLGTGEGGNNNTIEYPNKLRWMIFKVKQRAASNYFKKVFTNDSNLGETETKRISKATVDQFGNTLNVQFNWPYDFFSLVEMVKIDAEVEYNNIDYTNFQEQLPKPLTVAAPPNVIEYSTRGLNPGILDMTTAQADDDEYIAVGLADGPFATEPDEVAQDASSPGARATGDGSAFGLARDSQLAMDRDNTLLGQATNQIYQDVQGAVNAANQAAGGRFGQILTDPNMYGSPGSYMPVDTDEYVSQYAGRSFLQGSVGANQFLQGAPQDNSLIQGVAQGNQFVQNVDTVVQGNNTNPNQFVQGTSADVVQNFQSNTQPLVTADSNLVVPAQSPATTTTRFFGID
jgi:hypothetical protein